MNPSVTQVSPRYRWVVLALLAGNSVSGTFLLISLGLLLPAITQDIPMTPLQQGWLGSAQLAALAVLSLPAASLWSRYDPRLVFAGAGLLGALLIFGQAMAPGYTTLLLARTGFGLAALAMQTASVMLARQWFADREIALMNGAFLAVIGLGEFSAASTTPFLIALLGGWRPVLMIIGIWTLGLSLLWILLGRQRLTREYRASLAGLEKPALSSLFRHRDLWPACLGLLGPSAAWVAFGTFWPSYMGTAYGVPLTTSGWLYGLISLATVPAGLGFGYMASRWGRGEWTLIGCGLAMAAFSLAMLLTSSVPWLAAASVVVGAAWGFVPIVSTMPYVLPGITPRETAVASSLIFSMFGLGGLIGPITTGFIIQMTGSAFAGLALMCVLPLLLAVAGLRFRGRVLGQVAPRGR